MISTDISSLITNEERLKCEKNQRGSVNRILKAFDLPQGMLTIIISDSSDAEELQKGIDKKYSFHAYYAPLGEAEGVCLFPNMPLVGIEYLGRAYKPKKGDIALMLTNFVETMTYKRCEPDLQYGLAIFYNPITEKQRKGLARIPRK